MARDRMRWAAALMAATGVAGCGGGGPLEGLDPADRSWLFADSQTTAVFMGQPVDPGPLACNPQRMNQAYALVDTRDSLWLDSVRPTGVERHRVVAVERDGTGYVVRAQNGVGVPFVLNIRRTADDRAAISWDGAQPAAYLRCETPTGA